jgi:cytoskeletal protein CcmA (bactofilin family)
MFSRDLRASGIETLIGKSARIAGDVEFEGGLHLDGRIGGNVRASDACESNLTVSESGEIQGTVRVQNLKLFGRVRGDLYVRGRLVLGPTARVEGNVHYAVIEMTLGAQIMGKLVRLQPASPAAAALKGATG